MTVTILTEGSEPPEYESLEEAAEAIETGNASGAYSQVDVEVTEDEMRELLLEQGSDPEFLIMPDEDDQSE